MNPKPGSVCEGIGLFLTMSLTAFLISFLTDRTSLALLGGALIGTPVYFLGYPVLRRSLNRYLKGHHRS